MDNELRRVIETVPGLAWTALPDGRIDFLNRRWCEYTGFGMEKDRSLDWPTVIHGEDLPGFLDGWQSILASREPRDIEARLRRFDGVYRWFLLRASPMTDAAGQIVSWCGVGIDIDDQRQADAAVRERVDRLCATFDDFPAMVVLLTPDGHIEVINRRFEEFFGTTLAGIRERAPSGFVHPDDLPGAIAAWRHALETNQPYEDESRHCRADGRYRWLHIHASPLRDGDGRIALWCVLLTDVDDRRSAETMLAGEKQLLEMVASGRPLPEVLDALCRIFDSAAEGCSSSVLLFDRANTRVAHAIGPGLPDRYIEFVRSWKRGFPDGPCTLAASAKAEVIVSDVASDARWASGWRRVALAHGLKSCLASPILSLTGELLGTSGFYRREPGSPAPAHQGLILQFNHIAGIAIERTRSDEALKRSEANLKEAQRVGSLGSFSWRVETNEVFWSEEASRMYGLDPSVPATLEAILSRTHPEDVQLSRQVIEQARSGVEHFDFERRLLMPDQAVKYLHVLAHCARNVDGELELFGTLHDVTGRRVAEQALDKLRSELAHVARVMSLGTLTASIAHEVNQPLAGIITNASTGLRMLADDPPNLEGARETARRTIRDGNRASAVIARLRALFRKQSTGVEALDLNEATREVIALSRNQMQRARVILREELAHDLPPVTGDRVQLQQVILNLLLNATEAMSAVDDRERLVAVRTERDGDARVRLSVRDVGVGLEPHSIDRVFEPFFTTKPGGMGIGLAVSRTIIESHSGRMWATQNDGPGATFSFAVPCRPEAECAGETS